MRDHGQLPRTRKKGRGGRARPERPCSSDADRPFEANHCPALLAAGDDASRLAGRLEGDDKLVLVGNAYNVQTAKWEPRRLTPEAVAREVDSRKPPPPSATSISIGGKVFSILEASNATDKFFLEIKASGT